MSSSGRPSIYTEEIAAEVVQRLENGELLRAICRDDHLPDESTIRLWARENYNGFYPQYARAREIGWDVRAERLIEDAAGATPDNHQCMRLRIDTEKWLLSKVKPERYGDKVQHTGGDGEGPIKHDHDIEFRVVYPEKRDDSG